jgi:hypothetical protein
VIENGRIEEKMQQELMRHIWHHRLFTYGYVLPRSIEDVPVRIPDDFWAGKVDWEKSAVEGNGLSFISVRIVHPNSEKQTRAQLLELPAPTATRGPVRASMQQVTYQAYSALRDARQIDFGSSMKAAAKPIRAYLVTHTMDYRDNRKHRA